MYVPGTILRRDLVQDFRNSRWTILITGLIHFYYTVYSFIIVYFYLSQHAIATDEE